MRVSGTQIQYFYICKRKLWLYCHNIELEHTSEAVAEGKYISDSTYRRENHEVKIDGISLDFIDKKNRLVNEIKKSDSMEEIHITQLKYYLLSLETKGILGFSGMIDYPKQKQRIKVLLDAKDKEYFHKLEEDIIVIKNQRQAPEVENLPYCKKCAYYDLCYS
ncbi:MAG: CRISPR-associated protein Cas4 [Ignavibacteriaceae bacterium]|nr:CRISPR-associated protein Cas4 [Ignavibacteriaceae bacterium]